MKVLKIVILIVAAVAVFQLGAADRSGKFAVKGAGKRSCTDFVTSYDEKNTDYYLYGGWLEGFVSSYNQFQDKTYDAVPWQTTELMLALLHRYCKSNEKVAFLTAVNRLLKSLFPARITTESDIVEVAFKQNKSYYYKDVIVVVQQRLKELGFYQGETDGNYQMDSIEALLNFQKQYGLTQSGLPDQQTLTSLLLRFKVEDTK